MTTENGRGNDGKTAMLLIAVVSLVMNVAIVVAGGVWVVSKIGTTTEVLGVRIETFGRSVDKLSGTLEANTEKLIGHELRIQRVEDRQQNDNR